MGVAFIVSSVSGSCKVKTVVACLYLLNKMSLSCLILICGLHLLHIILHDKNLFFSVVSRPYSRKKKVSIIWWLEFIRSDAFNLFSQKL